MRTSGRERVETRNESEGKRGEGGGRERDGSVSGCSRE